RVWTSWSIRAKATARPGSDPPRHSAEVDPHDDPSLARAGDFGHPGGGEDALGSHMDLIPGDVPRPCSHRIRLQRLRAAASSMVDGCFGEGIGDTALPVSRSDENTSHGPDAGIVLSLLAALPRRPVDAEEPE